MTIEEMDVLIEQTEKEIFLLERKKKFIKNSKANKNEKKGKLKPIEEELRTLKYQVDEMLYVKDQKIPFYEKLPKGSQFYSHYMNMMYVDKIHGASTDLKVSEQHMMKEIKDEI